MFRIAVCDDNTVFAQQIAAMVEEWEAKPLNSSVFTFDNGDDLLAAHKTSPFDIILLDVVMPLMNGIDTAREIRHSDKNVRIVFLTASPEYAVESYKVKADNYLLKPVDREALMECLAEITFEMSLSGETITVRGLRNVQKIPLDSIEYIEAQNKHIVFYLRDGRTLETTEPLHVHESRLTSGDGFFKCHRSYIVNINHISTYTLKEITMRSGCRIPISRSYHKEFETAFFSVLFGKAGEPV